MTNNNQTRVVERIKELVEALRVYINADGGDMEFVSYENKILTLRILGACKGCAFVSVTFDDGVKRVFLTEFKDDIKDVKFI